MSFFEFPHTRTYNNDLGWLIAHVIRMSKQLENFINLNTIKYADPIAWNITTQYEANTVVINPADGTAYISTQPVPSGVLITNTDYWTPIFNYGESMETLRVQIVPFDEKANTTASRAYVAGDLLWKDGKLWRVMVDMPIGTAFIQGSNIEPITVEQFIDERVRYYETAEKMFADKTLIPGMFAVTMGYGSINDGGNGFYNIESATSGLSLGLDNGYNARYIPEGKTYNVRALGGGISLDIYPMLFDMLHEIKTGDVIYFPAGYYETSDTICIPAGCTVRGDGPESVVYFNGNYGQYGTAFRACGDDITFENFKLNTAEITPDIIQGSMFGGIGFGVFDFDKWTQKHQNTPMESADRFTISGIVVRNIWSDSNYLVQTEVYNGQTCTDLLYENINAPRAKISFGGIGTGRVLLAEMRHIVANLVGNIGAIACAKSVYEDINCAHLHVTSGTESGGTSLCSNIVMDTDRSIIRSGVYYDAIYLGSPVSMLKGIICRGSGNGNYLRYFTQAAATAYFSDVDCAADITNFFMGSALLDTTKIYFANCEFNGQNVNVKHGYAVNCNAVFALYDTFINASKSFAVYRGSWTATAPAYGAACTDVIAVPAGRYLLTIRTPGASGTAAYDVLGATGRYNMLGDQSMTQIVEFAAQTSLSIRILSSGITFTDIDQGFIEALKLS